MKKIFTFCIIAMMAMPLFAQDIIVTTNAQKIEAKILEVSKTEIKYKEKDNLDGPTFVLETTEINSIIYSNGKVVLYNQANEPEQKATSTAVASSEDKTTQKKDTLIPGVDYNVEILLLSGQVIKGKLMELANDYVAYTFQTKYNSIPASEVNQVTDIRNSRATVYNGKSLDSKKSSASSSSSAASTAKKGGRIYRDNGEYMYNNTYISQKEVACILERENYTAYKQWKKANGMLVGGSICVGIGGGLVLGGIYPLATGMYGVCIGIECAALVPLGIGLGLALGASAQYNKAIDIYNSKYDHAAMQLKLHVTANELGLAIAF